MQGDPGSQPLTSGKGVISELTEFTGIVLGARGLSLFLSAATVKMQAHF